MTIPRVGARRIVRFHGTVGVDERLQSRQIGRAGIFVVDLDAHTQLLRNRRRVEPSLRGIGGQRLIPITGIRDSSDGEHDPDVMALEIVHDVCGHPNGNTLRRLGIGGFVEQLERLDKTQDDEVDGGDTIPSINQPMVLAVELGHAAHRAPEALIVATGPGAVDRDGSGGGV